MSTSLYKVDYKCDCGINYGDCGAECSIILKSQNSVDIYTMYHTNGHYRDKDKSSSPKTTQEARDCFGDNYLSALSKLLTFSESRISKTDLTDEQSHVIFGK